MTRVPTKGMETHAKTCMEWFFQGCLPPGILWTFGVAWVYENRNVEPDHQDGAFVLMFAFGPILLVPITLWIATIFDKPDREKAKLVTEFLDSVQTPEFTLQGLEKLAKRKLKIDFTNTHVNYLFSSELKGRAIEVKSPNGQYKRKGERLVWRKL